jgi:hypothetical protein
MRGREKLDSTGQLSRSQDVWPGQFMNMLAPLPDLCSHNELPPSEVQQVFRFGRPLRAATVALPPAPSLRSVGKSLVRTNVCANIAAIHE